MNAVTRTHSTRRLALGTALVALVAVVWGAVALVTRGNAGQPQYVPDPLSLSEKNRSVDLSTLKVARTLSTSGVTWNVVTYQSSNGLCLDVEGEVQGSSEAGSVGGCGTPANPLLWSTGGISLGDVWYEVIFGQLPTGAESARITLADGTQYIDTPPTGQNVWVGLVASSGPTDTAKGAVLVEALDAEGNVVGSVQPPTVANYREEIANQEVSPSA